MNLLRRVQCSAWRAVCIILMADNVMRVYVERRNGPKLEFSN